MLDETYLKKELSRIIPEATLFCYEETDSTNERAMEYLRSGACRSVTVFIAERQTRGRGRRGRSFVSDGGGLYLSVLLPDRRYEDSSGITPECAVKISRAIKRVSGLKTEIKWVNDLYASVGGKRKKICGILAEAESASDGKSLSIVCGMGINVYKNAVSDEISDIATSIEEATGVRVKIEELAVCVLEEFFTAISHEELIREYRRDSMILGERISVIPFAAPQYNAIAIEILDDYSLLVETDAKDRRRVYSGEVSIRPL